ncbi:aminotransferase class I/II-fold pyridoxal phosphate-dependent enzyme [Sphingomonas sp. C3-2]|uniref:aminotransferase class I/II-fold pyridoxal phosphate-dependent enzyme n=1 Tax=Sphingomonas sp. C3-2 TaxID=3062169 RepID=UPI00294ACF2F|nr:aminotransferase class I/II-fold pyridoxal phosphate-dependent enzyme [Sphingomonas sp. C3-2]WOK35110.1 aminotransferase class I/II-fold pyridoxal phosphate-dependent enzyme [Sphingomonas sp. C3-2]
MNIEAISITRDSSLRQALQRMDEAGKGLLLLVDTQGRFERTITDGDLRRELLGGRDLDVSLETLPAMQSLIIDRKVTRREALALMNTHSIDHLPVVDTNGAAFDLLDRREIDDQILLSTPHMGDTEQAFIAEAFRTNWIAPLGPNVDAFEREVASLVGIGHAAAVSSGTAALHLAMRLLDVGPGDRVFCSTLTFAASVNPVVYQGATPVFIDSEPESWNMSPKALERAFVAAKAEGRLPKAVIVVNLYGQSADIDPIKALCDAHGVPIVEDAAESLGALYKGQPSGSFGLLTIFSFNGNKIITTSGGGMLLSNDGTLIERARFLATQARDPAPHYQHSEIGFNYRLSNVLAGVGRGQLKVLDDRVKARRAVFDQYRDGLSGICEIQWMPEPEWSYSTRWLSACTINPAGPVNSEQLRAHLSDDLIEARPVWKPMHRQPVFSGTDYFMSDNQSVADQLFQNGLCLPSGSNMSANQIERTIASIRTAFRKS